MTRFVQHRHFRYRSGFSLIELILVLLILALLIGLLLPAIAAVRQTASVLKTMDHERQIIQGVHQLSTAQEDDIRKMPRDTMPVKSSYTEQSIFSQILPYTYGELKKPTPPATSEEIILSITPPVKCYTDPMDPSLARYDLSDVTRTPAVISYSANMLAFNGFFSIQRSVPDGSSSTIAFTTHYCVCENKVPTELDPATNGHLQWDRSYPPGNEDDIGSHRRATFADKQFRDVMPVKDAVFGQTVASRRGSTFQVRPLLEAADARLPQSFYARGLQVALFDGSVRTIRPTVNETVFWSLVTPNGGEVVELPD
jgi:prepilin-type N-terminal cleavage/methylation domain-containing protein